MMNVLGLGLALLTGAVIGAVTMVTVQDSLTEWIARRQEQRRKEAGRWLAHEQAIIGRSIRRMDRNHG